jgi:hypothetical protein
MERSIMKTTTLAIAAATLLGGLTLGLGSASAATATGVQASGAPTSYVKMMSKRQMMMRDKKMMRRKMMMKKKGMM